MLRLRVEKWNIFTIFTIFVQKDFWIRIRQKKWDPDSFEMPWIPYPDRQTPPPVEYDGWQAVGAPVTSAPPPPRFLLILPRGRVGGRGLCGGRGLHLTGPGVEGDKAGPPALGVGGLQAQPQPL